MSYSLIVQLLNILQSPEVYVGLESTYNSADSFNFHEINLQRIIGLFKI